MSTLRVGDEGRVTSTVVNTEPRTVQDAVLVLETNTTTLRPEETNYPLGTILTRDRQPFRFDIDAIMMRSILGEPPPPVIEV